MIDFDVPGVILREVEDSLPERPRFAIAGFVGQAERGPLNAPQPLTNWGQYKSVFGGFVGHSYLPYAVYGFFRNGGERCYVVRVAHEQAVKASLVLVDAEDNPIIRVEAIDEGKWGNAVAVTVEQSRPVEPASPDEPVFKLTTRYQSDAKLVHEEVFDQLSMVESNPRYFVQAINGEPEEAEYARRERNGNSILIRVKDLRNCLFDVDDVDLRFVHDLDGGVLSLELRRAFRERGRLLPDAAKVKVEQVGCEWTIVDAGIAYVIRKESQKLKVYLPPEAVTWQSLKGGDDGKQNFGAQGYRYYTGWDVDANDYFRPIPGEADAATRRQLEQKLFGLTAFEAVEELGLVVIPDLVVPDLCDIVPKAQIPQKGIVFACPSISALKDKEFKNLRNGQIAMLQHCAKMGDRFAILDSPLGARIGNGERLNQDKNLIEKWPVALRADRRSTDVTKFGALYHPWLREQAADFEGRDLLIPPSGHVAGIYARTDTGRGFGKAPANEILQGVIALETCLSDSEQALLNPLGVNCLRAFPGRGIRVWGARTLSLDPLWRYVNVRRVSLAIIKSILVKLQWTVFEPNDRRLWDRITATLTLFFKDLLASGALAGNTPEEAFLVKCNEETNPEDVRERGEVITEIQFAPARPAEFIVVTIKRTAESLTVSEKPG